MSDAPKEMREVWIQIYNLAHGSGIDAAFVKGALPNRESDCDEDEEGAPEKIKVIEYAAYQQSTQRIAELEMMLSFEKAAHDLTDSNEEKLTEQVKNLEAQVGMLEEALQIAQKRFQLLRLPGQMIATPLAGDSECREALAKLNQMRSEVKG